MPRGSKSVLRHVLIDISTLLAEQRNSSIADALPLLRQAKSAHWPWNSGDNQIWRTEAVA